MPGISIPWLRYAAHGVKPDKNCDCGSCLEPWAWEEKDEWTQAILAAQQQIEDYINLPLCPDEICDELHEPGCPIILKHKPILYLGKTVYGERIPIIVHHSKTWWPSICPFQEMDMCSEYYESRAFIDRCHFPGFVTKDNLYFEYESEDLIHMSQIQLAQPRLKEIWGEDDNGQKVLLGWMAVWPKYELAHPAKTNIDISKDKDFMCTAVVRWRRVDESLAYQPVKYCARCTSCDLHSQVGCGVCHPDSQVCLTIADKKMGTVCVQISDGCGCSCRVNGMYINYAFGMDCSPRWELVKEMVVKLAISKLHEKSRICSCEEWREVVRYWKGTDPSADRAYGDRWKFGTSMAGIAAMHIADILAKTPKRYGNITQGSAYSKVMVATKQKRSALRWR